MMKSADVKANYDRVIEMGEKYIIAVTVKWKDLRLSTLGPKFHALSHFIQQLKELKGFGPFHEQFIELDHKDGNSELRRCGALRDAQARAVAISKQKIIANLGDVIHMKTEHGKPLKKRKRTNEFRLADKAQVLIAKRKRYLDAAMLEIQSGRNTQIVDYWKTKLILE